MTRVGRPSEKDSEGNPISKSLVNVTIPVKLRDFLKRLNVNRSQLFTKVVTQMYQKEICPKCYSMNISENMVGWFCEDCERIANLSHDGKNYFHWIGYKCCENCDEPYNLPYNKFCQSKDVLKGCYDCIPPKERL